MRDFLGGAGRLRALGVGARLLYTAFALSALVGLWVSWELYGAVVGEGGAAAYYAGGEDVAAPRGALPGEGPELDLPPEDARPREMHVLISRRKLLEVTHFHLFSIPLYLLVLGHLWLLARIPPWLQAGGVAAGIVATGAHLAAPWIVRGRPEAIALFPVSGVAMLVVLAAMAVVPVADMWLPRRREPGRGDPTPAP